VSEPLRPAEREEIEIKLPCPDPGAIRDRLRTTSAVLKTPLHSESNDLYDDERDSLRKGGQTLRMRRAGDRTLLTFKGPPRFQGGVKTRVERETDVADGTELEAILIALGYRKRFRYEKTREEWALEGCVLALDHTPIGDFLEVEGDPPNIRRVLVGLGLDSSAALPYSYARLYAESRRKDPSLPEDMVFTRGDGR
jgi:adenylate cyclase class 2